MGLRLDHSPDSKSLGRGFESDRPHRLSFSWSSLMVQFRAPVSPGTSVVPAGTPGFCRLRHTGIFVKGREQCQERRMADPGVGSARVWDCLGEGILRFPGQRRTSGSPPNKPDPSGNPIV